MINRIKLLKKIDAVIGPLFLPFFCRREASRTRPAEIKNILVVRPGGLGDAALLLPSLKAVKNANNSINIDVLCEKRNAGVFKGTHYVDGLYFYDNPLHLLKLFNCRYDLIIDTEQSHILSSIISAMLRGKFKIGFAINDRQCVYDLSVSYRQNEYEACSFWNLFRTVMPIPEYFTLSPPYFFLNENETEKLNTIIPVGLPLVCLFPGATVKERLWEPSNWSRLVDFFEDHGYQVLLLGGGMEVATCETILRNSKQKQAMSLAGRLSIRETSRILEKSALLISTDSGILHVGVLSGAPTVSLFGSGIALKWGPEGDRHEVVNLNLSCSPCTLFGTTPPCPNDFACMEIPADMVIDASRRVLRI